VKHAATSVATTTSVQANDPERRVGCNIPTRQQFERSEAMAKVRVFQIPIEDGKKIVYIPELLKLFIVPKTVEVGNYIEAPDHSPAVFKPPKQQFRRCDLILNNFCNLRCIYCYSNAGVPLKKEMSFVVAQKAIDRVVAVCLGSGESKFGITLTGGGEPLLSLKLVQQIVRYCRTRSKETGLICKLAVVSNGNFSEKICGYLIENFDNISISIDGTPKVHNQHRPTATGKGSFTLLERNVDRLLASGKIGVGFRMTISSYNVEQLDKHVLFLHHRWPGVLIGMEPLENTGRCASIGTIAPDPIKFAKHFVHAMRISKEHGIQIRYSIATFKAVPNTISFCGINGRIFGVDPEGNITACTRVNTKSDPLAPLFQYGSFDTKLGDFVIYDDVYARLGALVVDSIPGCNDCFARYNCKGDCCHLRANKYGTDFVIRKSPKCYANRLLTLGLLCLALGLPEVFKP